MSNSFLKIYYTYKYYRLLAETVFSVYIQWYNSFDFDRSEF